MSGPEKRSIPALTGIRALAALLVLLLHAGQSFPTDFASVGIIQKGYLGVDLFFLLSGFILTYVYFDSMQRPTGRTLAIFMWHRFIRLYPVHIAVLAALVVVVINAERIGLNLRSPEAFRFHELTWQILLVHAWGVTDQVSWNIPSWSISAEWFAYLCFPLVAACLRGPRKPRTLLLIAAASLGFAALTFIMAGWKLSGAWIAPSALVRIAGSFVCGAALCRYATLRHALESKSAFNDAAAMLALLLFLVGPSFGMPDFALIGLLAIFLGALGMSSGITAKLFSLAPLIWLGEISYSLYMVHFPVMRVVSIIIKPERLQPLGSMATFAALWFSIGACVVCAAAMFYFVERPLRGRLRNVIGRLPASKPIRQFGKAV